MSDSKTWGVVFYAPPPRWKRYLARVIPWYEPQDRIIGASTKAGDWYSPEMYDHGTIRMRWFSDGTFTIEDEEGGKS